MKKKTLLIVFILTAIVSFSQNGTLTVGNLSTQRISGAVLSQPNGYQLNGTDAYLTIPDSDNLDFPGTPFTYEFLLSIPSDITTVQFITNKGANGFALDINAGILEIGTRANAWTTVSLSPYAGKKIHLVAGWDGTNKYCYINALSIINSAQSTNLVQATSLAQYIGIYENTSSYPYKGEIYLTRLYNRALSAAEVTAHFNNGFPDRYVLPYADWGGSQTALTSGTLIKNKKYRINTFVSGDDFTNIGGTNVTGNEFTATGTTPTTWTHSSSLVEIGCVGSWSPETVGVVSWIDETSNHLNAAVTGGAYAIMNPQTQWGDTQAFTTDISSTGKVLVIPAGYYVDCIKVYDIGTTAGLTGVEAVQETSTVALITGKTVATGTTAIFNTIADHQVYSVNKNLTIKATGNSALGMRVVVRYRKAN